MPGRGTVNKEVSFYRRLTVSSTADILIVTLGDKSETLNFLDAVKLRNYISDFTNDYRNRHRSSLIGEKDAKTR